MRILVVVALLVFSGFFPLRGFGYWSSDPTVGTRVDDGPNRGMYLSAVPDRTGGAVLHWFNYALYSPDDTTTLQRINGNGQLEWGLVDANSPDYNSMGLVSWQHFTEDGNGNFYTVIAETINSTRQVILVQKFNLAGAALWPGQGVRVTEHNPEHQTEDSPALIISDDGQVIVFWTDLRISGRSNIYGQKLDANGVSQWAADGVRMSQADTYQTWASAVPDGSGGAILTFLDSRLPGVGSDIWGQRVSSTGQILWDVNDVAICTAASYQRGIEMYPVGSGGAVLAWSDTRNGNYDLFAQRIDGAGLCLWDVEGVLVSTDNRSRYQHSLVGNNQHAWVSWYNTSAGSNPVDVRVQKLDIADGSRLWTDSGIVVKTNAVDPEIVRDDNGDIVVGWLASDSHSDVYVQRLDMDGNKLWDLAGAPVCVTTATKSNISFVPVGNSSFVVAWLDARNSTDEGYGKYVNPYAAYLKPDGTLLGTSVAGDWQLYD